MSSKGLKIELTDMIAYVVNEKTQGKGTDGRLAGSHDVSTETKDALFLSCVLDTKVEIHVQGQACNKGKEKANSRDNDGE